MELRLLMLVLMRMKPGGCVMISRMFYGARVASARVLVRVLRQVLLVPVELVVVVPVLLPDGRLEWTLRRR